MDEYPATSLMFFGETADRNNAQLEAYALYGPEQIEENVFVGRSLAASGEPVYLRMELITEENQGHWMQYKQSSYLMSESNGRSMLTYLSNHIKKSSADDEQVHYTFQDNGGQSCSEASGLSGDEFAQFITYLGEQGFTSGSRKSEVLRANSCGSNHMVISSLSGAQYIIFASKTPDFLIREVPVIQPSPSIKAFKSQYNDLLMTVGSDFSCPTSFYNRGISRNPLSVIDNTYKGLAMILHGFTAAVAKRFFPSKQCMKVRPVDAMQHLICASLKPENVRIEGRTFKQASERAKFCLQNPSISSESGLNTIDVSVLAEFYYNKSRPAEVLSNNDASGFSDTVVIKL